VISSLDSLAAALARLVGPPPTRGSAHGHGGGAALVGRNPGEWEDGGAVGPSPGGDRRRSEDGPRSAAGS
jgi:hypothetical protein